MKLTLKNVGGKVEILLDDKEVELNRLVDIDLDIGHKKHELTLTYLVDDLDIELDNVEVDQFATRG